MMPFGADTTHLRWHALPPLWVIVLILVPAVFLAVRFVYKREAGKVGRRPRITMGVLRSLAILLILMTLFGPYAETIHGEHFDRHLILLIDTSRSMGFRAFEAREGLPLTGTISNGLEAALRIANPQ